MPSFPDTRRRKMGWHHVRARLNRRQCAFWRPFTSQYDRTISHMIRPADQQRIARVQRAAPRPEATHSGQLLSIFSDRSLSWRVGSLAVPAAAELVHRARVTRTSSLNWPTNSIDVSPVRTEAKEAATLPHVVRSHIPRSSWESAYRAECIKGRYRLTPSWD